MTGLSWKLNTGATIPALGFGEDARAIHNRVLSVLTPLETGTWQAPPGEVQKAVAYAIKAGYRHIDCAYAYGNEAEVAEGIKEGLRATGLKRSDLFITTKLWCTYHSRAAQALDKSLSSLELEYVDLYLMHWPLAMNPNGNHDTFPKHPDGTRDLVLDWSHVQTWKDMEKLMSTGKVKAIGVANYSVKFLEELLPQARIVPAVNQIENHPFLPQQDTVDFCKAKGIHITAYSPLGSSGSPLLKAKAVLDVAKETGSTPGCVLVSYHIARGSSVLVKSVTPSRIEENLKTVKLSASEMAALDKISAGGVERFVYPEFGFNFGFPDKQ